jgi:hypothetical protein
MAQMEEVVTANAGAAIVEYPRMSWGSIIAGWLVATGVASVMYVGGLAIGFSVLDPHDPAAVAKGIGIGTCLWLVLTWVVALFLGGLFASWADGRDDPTMGTVQGVTVWGLSIAASGLLLAIGMGGALSSGALLRNGATMSSSAAAVGAGAQVGGNADTTNLLQAELVQRINQQGMQPAAAASAPDQQADARMPPAWVGPRTARAVTLALLGGHPDTAKALLSGNTRLSPTAINAVLQGLSPQVAKARTQLKAAAATAAHYSAVAMWILLAAVLLSLLAAAIGGGLGASHVHRVYHLRRYARRVS